MKGVVIEADWAPKPTYPVTEAEERDRRARDGSQVWRDPQWAVAERPEPALTEPDQVIVAPRACGLCGSDLHMYETDEQGYILLPYRTRFPVAVGHEISGEVVAVGSDVRDVAPGDAVAVEALSYCGSCRACRVGRFNQCIRCEDLGFTLDGGTSDYVLTRERHCWSLNELRERDGEESAYEIGALVEPTSVAYNGMFLTAGGFAPGQDVAVFGCGPIGLAAVALAAAAGAGTIIAVDTKQARRELASAMGATATVDPAQAPVREQIAALTHGNGVRMAVEASGVARQIFGDIERILDIGGKVVLIGLEPGSAPITTAEFQTRAASVHGTIGHLGGGFGAIIALHAAGRLDMRPIVTARFARDRGVEAVRQAVERRDAKVLIKPHL
jgi:hypothetical protein